MPLIQTDGSQLIARRDSEFAAFAHAISHRLFASSPKVVALCHSGHSLSVAEGGKRGAA